MALPENQEIAGRLDEVAQLFAEQGANRFRVQAYQHAATAVRQLSEPVSAIYGRAGLDGLQSIPGVGPSIARSIRDLITHGRLAMLDRLRGEHDPIALLRTVPGIGHALAWRFHEELGLNTLADLEAAAHDGRLENLAGLGSKRLAGIRDTLAQRLGRFRAPVLPSTVTNPPVAELLDVDQEYLRGAASDTLKKIAPRRFNPTRQAWLPVLHTSRGGRHYTALFSNTARAHQLNKTNDWVVLYHENRDGDQQYTVITGTFGRLKGLRIVRGREPECEEYYHRLGRLPLTGQPRQSQLPLAS